MLIETAVAGTTRLRQSRRMYFYALSRYPRTHILCKEEEDEPHAVDEHTNIGKEILEGSWPQVARNEVSMKPNHTDSTQSAT